MQLRCDNYRFCHYYLISGYHQRVVCANVDESNEFDILLSMFFSKSVLIHFADSVLIESLSFSLVVSTGNWPNPARVYDQCSHWKRTDSEF
jgi:hypothetical protein